MISTADVKPIEDVVAECRVWFLAKLPGNRDRAALWSAFGEAYRVFAEGRAMVEEFGGDDRYERYRRFQAHGEVYAATKVIRAIAEGIGVSNFR